MIGSIEKRRGKRRRGKKDVRQKCGGKEGVELKGTKTGECGRLSFAFETTVKKRELCAASLGVRACVREYVRAYVCIRERMRQGKARVFSVGTWGGYKREREKRRETNKAPLQ